MRLVESAQVGSDEVRSLLRSRGCERVEIGDAGQHDHRRDVSAARAGDVGVQAVADDNRSLRAGPGRRLVEQRSLRLSRHDRLDARGGDDECGERPHPGQWTARRRQRCVEIRGDEQRACADRDARFSEPRVVERRVIAHDDRRRLGVGVGDHAQTRCRYFVFECLRAGDKDRSAWRGVDLRGGAQPPASWCTTSLSAELQTRWRGAGPRPRTVSATRCW